MRESKQFRAGQNILMHVEACLGLELECWAQAVENAAERLLFEGFFFQCEDVFHNRFLEREKGLLKGLLDVRFYSIVCSSYDDPDTWLFAEDSSRRTVFDRARVCKEKNESLPRCIIPRFFVDIDSLVVLFFASSLCSSRISSWPCYRAMI